MKNKNFFFLNISGLRTDIQNPTSKLDSAFFRLRKWSLLIQRKNFLSWPQLLIKGEKSPKIEKKPMFSFCQISLIGEEIFKIRLQVWFRLFLDFENGIFHLRLDNGEFHFHIIFLYKRNIFFFIFFVPQINNCGHEKKIFFRLKNIVFKV